MRLDSYVIAKSTSCLSAPWRICCMQPGDFEGLRPLTRWITKDGGATGAMTSSKYCSVLSPWTRIHHHRLQDNMYLHAGSPFRECNDISAFRFGRHGPVESQTARSVRENYFSGRGGELFAATSYRAFCQISCLKNGCSR
jgi:hypothetical protein